jgi:hypothetical protein
MPSLDCAHCLYPTFTQRLLRRLADERRSVNLIGLPGDGARRVLQDLRALCPPDVRLLYADCQNYRHDYAGLMAALAAPLAPSGVVADMAGLSAALDTIHAPAWLMLDRFDSLFNSPDLDVRYNCQFFVAHINSLRNRRNLVLLTLTARPHRHYVVLCDGKNTSPPDLEPETVPHLDESAMRAELRRCVPDLLGMEAGQVVDAMRGKPQAYARLEFIANKLENGENSELPFAKRLRKWRREFDDVLPEANVGNLRRLTRWLRGRLRIFYNAGMELLGEVLLVRKMIEKWQNWRGEVADKPEDKP